MDLGAVLRNAREQRGLSLDDLSHATKINVSTLRALEENQFDHVAHGIFVRGFLRAYAHEVGLDAERIVEQYRSEFEPASLPLAGDITPADSFARHDEPPEPETSASSRTAWVLIVVVLIAVAGYFSLRQRTPVPVQTSAPVAAPAAPVPAETPAPAAAPAATPVAAASSATPPVATTGAEGSAAAQQPQDGSLRVELRTSQSCWIAATADGVRVTYQVLPAGDQRTIAAHTDIVLRVGEPSALTYTVNGLPGRSLGPAGEPVTVRITSQNFRDFVTP